mgnify:CR=1 FL=1
MANFLTNLFSSKKINIQNVENSSVKVINFENVNLKSKEDLKHLLSQSEIEKTDSDNKASFFRYADQVLGLDLDRPLETKVLTPQMKTLLDERALARTEKRWADSDRLRVELENFGLEIKDTPEGQSWS